MRRAMIATALTALLALTACGAQSAPGNGETPPEGDVCDLREAPPPALFLEREVYDPSLTTFTYFVRNDTDGEMEFGEDYRIQRLGEDGEWADLTPRENWGFNAAAYVLPPGGEKALTCTLDMYEGPPEPGKYLLVKDLGGEEANVLFYLGESPYTAETPYGLTPLEDLPEDYRVPVDSKDCVVLLKDSLGNPKVLEDFLWKSGLDAPCQLRTVRYRSEGTPIVTDVLYENGRFLRRIRQDGAIAEDRFSYLVTDGWDLYLSNGADWASGEKYGDSRAPLVPEGTAAEELADAVEALTARRLEGNITRYQVWSRDGVWSAGLTDTPTEFSIGWRKPGEGSWGSVYDLQDWDGLETAITGISWREDGALVLTCDTLDGSPGTLCFDPETERLTSLAP